MIECAPDKKTEDITELIKISEKDGQQAVSARELHEFLGSKQRFTDWITNRIEKYRFIKNEDYEVFHKFMKNPSGGRPLDEYALTLDMAKELCMVENNDKGRQARRYFIEAEKRFNALKKEREDEIKTDRKHLLNAFATLEPDLEDYSNTILTLNFVTTRECFLKTILPVVKLYGGKYRGTPGYMFTQYEQAEEAQKEINTKCFNYEIPIKSLNNTSIYALRELGLYDNYKKIFKLKEKLYA
ncbi:MAG: antA/AntB antirepressor family protein [Bacteroidales bacterium]|nr:antA/AntB antirepressor family protein [Bacteroidales bacterium]MBQ7019273.1 antA/AntB antirepressor family protein [Bacteroidales bacterium]